MQSDTSLRTKINSWSKKKQPQINYDSRQFYWKERCLIVDFAISPLLQQHSAMDSSGMVNKSAWSWHLHKKWQYINQDRIVTKKVRSINPFDSLHRSVKLYGKSKCKNLHIFLQEIRKKIDNTLLMSFLSKISILDETALYLEPDLVKILSKKSQFWVDWKIHRPLATKHSQF